LHCPIPNTKKFCVWWEPWRLSLSFTKWQCIWWIQHHRPRPNPERKKS